MILNHSQNLVLTDNQQWTPIVIHTLTFVTVKYIFAVDGVTKFVVNVPLIGTLVSFGVVVVSATVGSS